MANASSKLARLAAGATRSESPTADNIWDLSTEPKLQKETADLIRISVIQGELDPIVKQAKKEVYSKLFARFTDEWWRTKTLPKNPKIVIKKLDKEGKPTEKDDMSISFIVKENRAGLTALVPDADKLADEKMTPEDYILDKVLIKMVGMSKEQGLALLLAQDKEAEPEISIKSQVVLADSLDKLLNSSNKKISKAAEKLIDFMSMDVGDKAKLEPMTDEERKLVLVTKQFVLLKENFFQRIHLYCTDLEMFRKLLGVMNVGMEGRYALFAISDKVSERLTRMQDTIFEFLSPDEEEEEEEAKPVASTPTPTKVVKKETKKAK
jgi:hypothetical protein